MSDEDLDLPAPDPILNRKQAAQLLTKLGFPIAHGTLANWASNNSEGVRRSDCKHPNGGPEGGPPYYKLRGAYKSGRRTFYKTSDLIAWLSTKLVRVE